MGGVISWAESLAKFCGLAHSLERHLRVPATSTLWGGLEPRERWVNEANQGQSHLTLMPL